MKQGFFRSREFIIAAVAAGLILTGVVAAFAADTLTAGVLLREGCTVPLPEGEALEPTVDDTGVVRENGRVTRTLTYTLTPDLAGGTVSLCTEVGDLEVAPSPTDEVRVVFTIGSDHTGSEEAVAATEVDAKFTDHESGLGLAAWQVNAPRVRSLFDWGDSVNVHLTVLLPDSGAYALSATTDVGDVNVAGLQASRTHVMTDVGDATLTRWIAAGDVTVSTDVGDVEAEFTSVQTGKLTLSTDVGDMDVSLPRRADVGYLVHAATDVGDVRLDLGPTEDSSTDDDDPAGDRVETRTAGYDGKPTQVEIHASADVGDITLKSGSPGAA